MEFNDIVNGSGFFFTGLTDISIAIALLSVIQSRLVSLSSFFFIVPLFVAGVGLRGLWLWRSYKKQKKISYAITAFLVAFLGAVVIIGLSLFVLGLSNLLPIGSYAANPILISLALVWTVYTLAEVIVALKGMNRLLSIYSYGIIIGVLLGDTSIIYLISVFPLLLPASIVLVALLNFLIGIDFLGLFYTHKNL